MSPKSTPSDKLLLKVSLLTIKNSLTRLKKDKLKSFSFNTTELFWLLTQEDANLKNTVDLVPEPDIKNLTDDNTLYTYHHYFNFYAFYLLSLKSENHWLIVIISKHVD